MGKQAAAGPKAAAAKPAAKPDAKSSGGAKAAAKPAAKPAAAKSAGAKAEKGPSKGDKAPAPSAKTDKANKRSEREAAEAARRAERDAMLPPSASEESESEGAEEDNRLDASRLRAIAERDRAKAEEEQQQLRKASAAAAKASAAGGAAAGRPGADRGAGGYPAAQGRRAPEAPGNASEDDEEEETIGGSAARSSKAAAAEAAMLQKVEKGAKLSNKERRLYEKHLRKEEDTRQEQTTRQAMEKEAPEVQRWLAECKDFQLIVDSGQELADGTVVGGGDAVSVDQFSLLAPGQDLLSDASLVLAKGRRYGFLGPNGMGKTTLLKHMAIRKFPIPASWTVALVAQEAPATERCVVEEVLSANVERQKLTKEEAELFEKLEAGGSDDPAELAKLCERLAQVGAELEATGAEAAESQVRQILVGLQFTDKMMEGPVRLLSGGWRMRVSLAKALFLQPDLLLLDEPTNHLDLDAVIWLDEFLSTEFKKTLLVVSHDADFLDSVCTDIVHLEDQKLWQYRGAYTQFKKMHAQRIQERDKEFKKLVIDVKKATGSKARKMGKEELEKARPPKQYTVKFNFLPLVTDKEDAGISVHDINFSYTGKKPWLLGPQLNFRMDASMRIAVVGKNGAGKSTLLNLLTKTLWPNEGNVVHAKGLSIGRYSQHFEELGQEGRGDLSPIELLTDPEVRRFGAGIEKKEHAHKSLGQFGLPTHAHTRPIKELSGGQKARVQFALLTCRRPEILVLDEPTNHLDIESVEEIISALRKYEGGFIFVSHDARLITATQATLWEVDGSGTVKTRGEGSQGFSEYRRGVLLELHRKRRQEEERAAHQMEARRRRREQALAARGTRKT